MMDCWRRLRGSTGNDWTASDAQSPVRYSDQVRKTAGTLEADSAKWSCVALRR